MKDRVILQDTVNHGKDGHHPACYRRVFPGVSLGDVDTYSTEFPQTGSRIRWYILAEGTHRSFLKTF